MRRKLTALDVAICPGCGRTFTRAELARGMVGRLNGTGRQYGFACKCEWEWNDYPYRPPTLQEVLDGDVSLPVGDLIDIDAYTLAVIAVVRQVEREERA